MIDVKITKFNVQLCFKESVLQDLSGTFLCEDGFVARQADGYAGHPMQKSKSFFLEGFRIAPVQSKVLLFRILQVISYQNTLQNPAGETLVCLHFVSEQLQKRLSIDLEKDIYAVRVVVYSVVTGNIKQTLSKLSGIESIPTLVGMYVARKNPTNSSQIVTKTENDLVHRNWSDIRVNQFSENSYVVTIFNETRLLVTAMEYIEYVKQFVANLMQEMEQASQA